MSVDVKICGITTDAALEAALEEKAAFVGFVFYPPSPRNIDSERAADLAARSKDKTKIVALFVDPTDAHLDSVLERVKPDYVQLHGAETPARLRDIRARYGVKLIKAIPVSAESDTAKAKEFSDCADLIIFDAKPAKEDRTALPGGNGIAFDWQAIENLGESHQFMLSGGLNPDNVREAIRVTGARAVDVSSGVEISRGEKDPDLIRQFIRSVHQTDDTSTT